MIHATYAALASYSVYPLLYMVPTQQRISILLHCIFNGHVSQYSTASLALWFQPHRMKVRSFSEGLHLAYGEIPAFAAHRKLPQ
jgi:hypothetical protein